MSTITIKTVSPWMPSGETVHVTGNCEALGCWDPARAVAMECRQGIVWSASFDSAQIPGNLEYKFIRKTASGEVIWETCFNRTDPFAVSQTTFPDSHPRYAGTAVPVFSLRSSGSQGIGDFLDIRLLVDWAVLTHQAVIQLLPVNDTTSTRTWTDSYPYGGITIMALHPVYLNLPAVGTLKDKAAQKAFMAEAKALNALPQVDYEKVFDLKMRWAAELFREKGASLASRKDYKSFCSANASWIYSYAVFCVLRDTFSTADFSKWGEYSTFSAGKVEQFRADHREETDFYIFLQYHLDAQLRESHEYARSHGVALKGDIPIGITPHSVEAWAEPEYFNMGEQAGAPPDAFAADGQNWGFPTYNWDRMAEDGYAWWQRRFRKMAEYFDAYRIDHVLGFFRIWEIPTGYSSGLMGHFSPALPLTPEEIRGQWGFPFDFERDCKPYADDPNGVLFLEDPVQKGKFHPRISAQFTASYRDLQKWEQDAFNRLYDDFFYRRNTEYWREQAMKKLPALISTTNMLTCAEDLGMIPSCVPETLSALNILSLEVQRMPKDPSRKLGIPSEYPYWCVCTTGSHDTSTLRGWWGEEHDGEDCPVDACRWIVAEHLHSPAMLTILPLQDWFSVYEPLRTPDPAADRINIPANPKHYWRFRMHVTLEELVSDAGFNAFVAQMVDRSGRTR